MTYHARQSHAQKQITGAGQETELITQLYSCRPAALDAYRLEDLQRRYSKVPARRVEYLLTIARQNRKDEAR